MIKNINIQTSGNGKSVIIPREWLNILFGIIDEKEYLLNYLYINYDNEKKIINISKDIINEYFGIKQKIINIGKSYGIYISMKIIRHMFCDIYKIDYKTKNLHCRMNFDDDEKIIKIEKVDDDE
jgi:hypothetical protein